MLYGQRKGLIARVREKIEQSREISKEDFLNKCANERRNSYAQTLFCESPNTFLHRYEDKVRLKSSKQT